MKYRSFSIFAGIGQAIGMFVLLYLILFVLHTLIPDQILSFELLSIGSIVWLIGCITIGLCYPMYLLRQQRKGDGIVVISSTIISIVIFLGFYSFIVEQMFRGID